MIIYLNELNSGITNISGETGTFTNIQATNYIGLPLISGPTGPIGQNGSDGPTGPLVQPALLV